MNDIDHLIQSHLEGVLTPENGAELKTWLEADPANMDEFIQQLDVHTALWENSVTAGDAGRAGAAGRADAGSKPDAGRSLIVAAPRARAWDWRVAVAACLAVVVSSYILIRGHRPAQQSEPVKVAVSAGGKIGTILSCDERTVVRRAGTDLRAAADMPVCAGDEISTAAGGAATLSLETAAATILMDGSANLTLAEGHSTDEDGWVELVGGRIDVTVDRSEAHSRRFKTQHADIEVLGTHFVLAAEPGLTTLDVRQGSVRLTHRENGRPMEVSGGPYLLRSKHPAGETAEAEAEADIAVTSLTLLNASTGLPIPSFDPLVAGAVIDLEKLGTRKLNILANCAPPLVGCVEFSLNGDVHFWTERSAPYALRGDNGAGNYAAWTPSPGWHTVHATPFTGPYKSHKAGGTGEKGKSMAVRFRVVEGTSPEAVAEQDADIAVVSLTLMNAETGLPVPGFDPIPDEAVLDLVMLPTRELNIRANCEPPEVGCVSFDLDNGGYFWTEGSAPYALARDAGEGRYEAWTPEPGEHTLTVTPYASGYKGHSVPGQGASGRAHTIRFRVQN